MASKIDIQILKEAAPWLIREVPGINPRYDYDEQRVVSDTRIYFGQSELQSTKQPDPDHPDAARIIAEATQPRQTMVSPYVSPITTRWIRGGAPGSATERRFARATQLPSISSFAPEPEKESAQPAVEETKPANLKPTGKGQVLSSFADL